MLELSQCWSNSGSDRWLITNTTPAPFINSVPLFLSVKLQTESMLGNHHHSPVMTWLSICAEPRILRHVSSTTHNSPDITSAVRERGSSCCVLISGRKDDFSPDAESSYGSWLMVISQNPPWFFLPEVNTGLYNEQNSCEPHQLHCHHCPAASWELNCTMRAVRND